MSGFTFNRASSHGCPCKGCHDRVPGSACHDRCDRYKAWKAKVDAARKAEHDYHVGNDLISEDKKREIWRNSSYSKRRR